LFKALLQITAEPFTAIPSKKLVFCRLALHAKGHKSHKTPTIKALHVVATLSFTGSATSGTVKTLTFGIFEDTP